MLHFEAVDTPTLELLKKLMAVPLLKSMRLAGGTALALQTGHRISVDIDLFGEAHPEELELGEAIRSCGELTWLNKSKNIKSLLINGIKTDIVSYSYPWVTDMLLQDDLRLARPNDIAAMKLAAITGRGAKKDFVDLFFLLQTFSLAEMIDMYSKKYTDGSAFLVLKSLLYFEDAEEDEMPKMLIPVSWEQIKKTITKQHRNYLDRL